MIEKVKPVLMTMAIVLATLFIVTKLPESVKGNFRV